MSHQRNRKPRTLLDQLIRERNQTLEEFTDSAETYAREHGEPGTLSLRHLQRLITGTRPDGRPLGPVRPATARLLEHMLGEPVDRLLSRPSSDEPRSDGRDELRARIAATRRIDHTLIAVLHDQLNTMRRLDRELGATIAHDEVITKIQQVRRLLSYSLMPQARQQLAALLSELGTLAGWQALDLGHVAEAWQHYEHARTAATASGSPAYEAHAAAEQAFVLIDIGEYKAAAGLVSFARDRARSDSTALLHSWLQAAHGETLAHLHRRADSLRAFDNAAQQLSEAPQTYDGPYIVLDEMHLARWRGNALAQLRQADALSYLAGAVVDLDASFSRARAGVYIDLANAYVNVDDIANAQNSLKQATAIADEIGSKRQRLRANKIKKIISAQISK